MRSRLPIPILPTLLLLLPGTALSQQATQTEPVEALRDNTPGVHALTNARVVVAPGQVLENATLVLREGVVEAVGAGITPPADARVRDMEGHTLYPGFIDAHADLNLDHGPSENGDPGPVHWNPQVRAFFSAGDEFRDDEDRRAGLRAQGFTAAMAVPRLGIFRGQTAAVTLGDGAPRDRVLRSGVAQSVSFDRDAELGATYPNSAMGAIALMRQTLLDADWHVRVWEAWEATPELRRPERNRALAALERAARGEQPLVFEATREEEYLRARAIAEEFPVDWWVRGSGEEYRIVDVVGDTGVPLVLPLNFPEAPDVESPERALDVSLAELRHWYLAPENPARLAAAGVEFSFTADGLDDGEDFLPNLRAAVDRGLDRDVALAALTTNPARILGIEGTHGTLEAGKAANLVVVEGDLFDDDGEIRDVWIDGLRYEISPAHKMDPRGEWLVASLGPQGVEGRLRLEGTMRSLEGTLSANDQEVDLISASVRPEAGRLRVAFPGDLLGLSGTVRLSATVEGDLAYGWTETSDGIGPNWQAERVEDFVDADGSDGRGNGNPARNVPTVELADIRPAMEYGREAMPEQPEHVLVRGATIWTQGPQGRLEDADLLVTRGEIVEVGQGLSAPAGAVVIDGAGKHVTPGLIDAHLHAGTHGVNESGATIVPEVRLGDVVTHNNIWTYRQLAGGLTLAHVMHGSANPIGGQNVFVKMRWGGLPDELKYENAPRTVKFALGENPKRRDERYPDTRMGTYEIIRDHFQGARDYQRAWDRWEANGDGLPPRRDLRMEAIVDMLNEDLRIQSHGYRQDEFLNLVRVAEEFDFSIQALQHGVEAYKIAPELAESGVGAVVWSDWSSFKIEAYDATTYNARLLTEAGVLTSLHSDNSQLASRMNWEAGKMVRAGMEEEEALSLVTSNTARVLGIDDRVGSLEPGKDADFVIWNGHPLSQFTRAEETWVDGRKYFDLEEDRALRQEVERERARLIQAILESR